MSSKSPGPRRPVRRPQVERSQESRARVLAAAVDSLIEDGYAHATTARIQARAEVSRGRLLHQFPSKDELLVAAVHHVAEQRVPESEALAATLPSGLDEPQARIEAVVDLTWGTFDRPFFWAATELWVAARTSPTLARAILPAEREVGLTVRSTLDVLYGPELAAHALYPTVRDVVFTSMRGVALTYTFDDRDPATEPFLAQWKNLALAVLVNHRVDFVTCGTC